MNQKKLIPALWGGALIGVTSGIPVLNFINCACCAGVLAGGVLAVYMYRREIGPDEQITMNDGAILGLLAGIFGAVIGSILGSVFGAASMEYMQYFEKYIQDPKVREMIENIGTQGMTAGIFMMSLVLSIIINCIFGLLGGLLGVNFFGKSKNNTDAKLDNDNIQPNK